MKFLLVGDTHFRTTTPERRRETNFMEVCLGKLKQILQIFNDEHCDFILQAGDFFDSPNVSDELVAKVIETLMPYSDDGPILLAIHGQHDLAYHSDVSRQKSKLRVMEAAGVAGLLDDKPTGCGGATVYGASFGQAVPRPSDDAAIFNILVAHAMVGDKPLWPGHDLTGPEDYAKRNPGYDMYLLGDYHYPWKASVGDIHLFNCGVVVRRTAAKRELEHKPKVIVFDANTGDSKDVFLKVKLAEEAFDLTKIEKDTPRDPAALEALAAKLRKSGKVGVNFTENLLRFCEAEKVPDVVRKRILQALPQVLPQV